MKSKNFAIIGASYLQLPLILKAKEMGYVTHVFAWSSNDVGEKEADFFYPISIIEKDKILKKCKEIRICGISSIASDLAIITVNYVANHLGLISNSMSCTHKSTNKFLMRQSLKQGGDPCPQFILVSETDDLSTLNLSYPVIVKPTDRSGSRGVYKVNSYEELLTATQRAFMESFEKKVLIEEYANGKEYSVEYISHKGNHHFLSITEKFTTGAPAFIETGHLEPAPVDYHLEIKIKNLIEHALNTLEITEGASHSEIKIDEDGSIKIIEIGGRMGGDCIGSDLVYFSTGIDFVKAVIQIACGKDPELKPVGKKQPVQVNYIITESDRDHFYELKKNHPECILKEVYERYDLIGKTTDSSNRAGCYIIKPCPRP